MPTAAIWRLAFKLFNFLHVSYTITICVFSVPPLPPPPMPSADDFFLGFPAPPREPEPPKYLLMDGILVTQQAKKLIERNMMEAPKIKRNRRWGKKPEGWDDKLHQKGEIEKKQGSTLAACFYFCKAYFFAEFYV